MFHIVGIAQSGSLATAPVIDMTKAHLAVTPGGLSSFDGSLDEIRIFSFNPNTDNPVAALSLFAAVPEPATATLALLGVGVLMRRRQHA
jgi:PEP-CTERM motif